MRSSKKLICVVLGLLLTLWSSERADGFQGAGLVHHDLTVRVEPTTHGIEVDDWVSFPAGLPPGSSLRFLLHADLNLESIDPIYRIELVEPKGDQPRKLVEKDGGAPARAYRLTPADGRWPSNPRPHLRIRGTIHHPPVPEAEEYARGFSRSPGTIEEEGVLLSGATLWVPRFGGALVTFDLDVTVPSGWDAVSQGKRILHESLRGGQRVRWRSEHPMDEVYLVAGPYVEYRRSLGRISTYVFLRSSDANLATRYLDAAGAYINMYQELIGPYPYPKFALVENFWETGYGMPSFALLGSKVIRFPFILHSSYPHEILHNWWGNSVYVDYGRGNWSEGLTAYLADHLVKEGQGRALEYRRDTLARYRSYVREARDFPLREFRSRHSPATEAIGYGKSLMLWHMLRMRLGDETFTSALRDLYRSRRFRRTSFDDIAAVFSTVAGEDLKPFFHQWVDRTGAPQLSLECEGASPGRIRVVIRQEQAESPYDLLVPLAVTLEAQPKARMVTLHVDKRREEFNIDVSGIPVRVDLDPAFDVFRRLANGEVPVTLADVFGSSQTTIVLPDSESPVRADAWQRLAIAWSQQAGGETRIAGESELDELPEDGAVWVLGGSNRWAAVLSRWLGERGAGPTPSGMIRTGGRSLPLAGHSFVYVGTPVERGGQVIGWAAGDSASAIAGLARKLPHYGRYSYLVFSGDGPTNVAKGQWESVGSPLVTPCRKAQPSAGRASAPGGGNAIIGARSLPTRAVLPARKPLARPVPSFDSAALVRHVAYLASDELEGRGAGTGGLERAADYIAAAFRSAGLDPGGEDGSYFTEWSEANGPEGTPVQLRNVIGILRGSRREWEDQSVVIGAHYDHLGRGWPDVRPGQRGKVHNGADDNASGVAVLIELAARLVQEGRRERTIVFIAFSGEEWGRKGSRHYVKRQPQRWPVSKTIAMVNLDTVGRLGAGPLLMLGAGSADEWIHIAMGAGFTTGIEAKAVMDDVGGSDQVSFHEVGVPAVQIFAGAHADYHRPSDDTDKIDASGLAKVSAFVHEVVVYLAARDRPLTSTLGGRSIPGGDERSDPVGRRRASLGTVPDYAFAGPGVRVSGVMPGSPAARVGIVEGDVVTALDGETVLDLRTLAALLAAREPGDTIRVTVERGGRDVEFEATLEAR